MVSRRQPQSTGPRTANFSSFYHLTTTPLRSRLSISDSDARVSKQYAGQGTSWRVTATRYWP
jgi:hypothetical protein